MFWRCDTPDSDSSLDSITIKVETMEHPVLATDAEMDETRDGVSLNTRDDEKKKEDDSKNEKSDENEDMDDADAEERALSAMSIFSHDSDDDPTWAPTGTEKLKLDSSKGKSEKSAKVSVENIRNKVIYKTSKS